MTSGSQDPVGPAPEGGDPSPERRSPAADLCGALEDARGPELDLKERRGPTLELDALDPFVPEGGALRGAVVAVVGVAVLVLALAAMLMAMETLRPYGLDPAAWLRAFGETDAASPVQAQGEVEGTDAAAEPGVTHPASALVGQYCHDLVGEGDATPARQAFEALVWSRLEDPLKQLLLERLQVCMPFELRGTVVSGGGCAKSACGVEEVTFHVDEAGRLGIEFVGGGHCREITEPEFAHKEILCAK